LLRNKKGEVVLKAMKEVLFFLLAAVVLAFLVAFFKSVIWASRGRGRSWLDYRGEFDRKKLEKKPGSTLPAEEYFLAKLEKALSLNQERLTEEDRRILLDTNLSGFSEIMPDGTRRDIWMDRMINALIKLYDLEVNNRLEKTKQLCQEGRVKGFDFLLTPRQWLSMHQQLMENSDMIVLQCVVGGWLDVLSKRPTDKHTGEDHMSGDEGQG
jgi:hypothetical protein